MCKPEDIRKELEKNNKYRDKQLQRKLDELSEKLVNTINDRVRHLQTSPATNERLHAIQENCIKNTTNFTGIMREIKNDVSDIKKTLEKFDKTFMTKQEFNPYKQKIDKLMGIAWGIFIACGVIIVFYILIHVGLPTP